MLHLHACMLTLKHADLSMQISESILWQCYCYAIYHSHICNILYCNAWVVYKSNLSSLTAIRFNHNILENKPAIERNTAKCYQGSIQFGTL